MLGAQEHSGPCCFLIGWRSQITMRAHPSERVGVVGTMTFPPYLEISMKNKTVLWTRLSVVEQAPCGAGAMPLSRPVRRLQRKAEARCSVRVFRLSLKASRFQAVSHLTLLAVMLRCVIV
ncbi:unnamed protein product [Arctogadus glacialis]